MVLLDVSSNNFLQKHDFDHFDLILFKRLSCEISFYDFMYRLLDRITYGEAVAVGDNLQLLLGVLLFL